MKPVQRELLLAALNRVHCWFHVVMGFFGFFAVSDERGPENNAEDSGPSKRSDLFLEIVSGCDG
jgi:hypothetical protein